MKDHGPKVHGLLPDFEASLKIHRKYNFDQNQLKIYTQHKNMYVSENITEFFPSHF